MPSFSFWRCSSLSSLIYLALNTNIQSLIHLTLNTKTQSLMKFCIPLFASVVLTLSLLIPTSSPGQQLPEIDYTMSRLPLSSDVSLQETTNLNSLSYEHVEFILDGCGHPIGEIRTLLWDVIDPNCTSNWKIRTFQATADTTFVHEEGQYLDLKVITRLKYRLKALQEREPLTQTSFY